MGPPCRPSGRRVSADSWITSNATVTPASRCPTRSMATSSVGGSSSNAVSHAEGTLDADRQRRLQDAARLDMGPLRRQVGGGIPPTLQYVDRHGHARVPFVLHGRWLQARWWVNVQRNNYAEGTLDADRQRRLQDLPGWTWDPRADQWEEGFRRLLRVRRTPR